MDEQKILIVTGLSGAGKSQAIRVLEDMGYFCVDNLPPSLLPKFAELLNQPGGLIKKAALVVDIRGGEFFQDIFKVLDYLLSQVDVEILFLEASNETLVRRFKETRRRHPLSIQGEVLDGILEERKRLEELRGRANKVIDTSNLSNQELKNEIQQLFCMHEGHKKLSITVLSFGFKYGIPLDSDLVIDVRFLPNPHYIPELKPLTGNDLKVQHYVLESEATKEFMERFFGLVEFLIPHYIKEGKTSITIAIGCTGGQHRSVTLANKLGEILISRNNTDYKTNVRHRDELRNRQGLGIKC